MKQHLGMMVCGIGIMALTASVAAQSTTSPQSASPGSQTTQQQPNERQQTTQSQPAGNMVTLTGCVYEASDQPNVFALKRMNGAEGASAATAGNSSSQASAAGQTGATDNPAAASPGTQTRGTSGTAASGAADTEGAVYRLSPGATQNINTYVGQRVEIRGNVTPGRDERGADVVIHRIEPQATVVTMVDLKPAPQLSVSSVRALSGTCTPGSSPASSSPSSSPTPSSSSQPNRNR